MKNPSWIVFTITLFFSASVRVGESTGHSQSDKAIDHDHPDEYGYSVTLVNAWEKEKTLHCSCYTRTDSHERVVDVADIPFGEEHAHEGPYMRVKAHDDASKYLCHLFFHDSEKKKMKDKENDFEFFSEEIATWYCDKRNGDYNCTWKVEENVISARHSMGESPVYTW